MTAAAAIGIVNPFQWFAGVVASRREARQAKLAAMRDLGICTVCHANVATVETDYRCEECWLECNSAP